MAESYVLTSCDLTRYPTITNVCWKGRHPMEGLIVYINEGVIDQTKTYQLQYLGTNAEVCHFMLPLLALPTENLCSPTYEVWQYQNCETEELRTFGFPSVNPTKNIFRKDGSCDCWKKMAEMSAAQELVTVSYTEYDTCDECLETRADAVCSSGERTIGYAQMVNLPDAPPPDRNFSKCCFSRIVLADTADADPYRNDYTGVWFKRELPNSTVAFQLRDVATGTLYALNSATYGTFQDFGGTQTELSYYIVQWSSVLNLLGEGAYQIVKQLNIAGISVDVTSDTFNLRTFTVANADKTVRIDSIMDGMLVSKDTDFSNSLYKTTMRLPGFFGRAEYSFEQDNIAKRDYSFMQNTMSSKREYKYQALQIPECITEELWNFVLFGKELFISDYNGNNHSYKYELMPVKLEGNAGTEFFVTDRGCNINLTFSDRTENDRKINC